MEAELQALLLGAVEGGGGLSGFLSGSHRRLARDGLGAVRAREHSAGVVARRLARREAQLVSVRRAGAAWQAQARVRAARRAVVKELRSIFDALPVSDALVRGYLDGEPGPVPARVRRAMVARLRVNKCSACGEAKPLRAFRSRPDDAPATRCLVCERPGTDPMVRLLARLCSESAARCRKRARDGKTGSEHDISVEYLVELFEAQDGRCALCGLWVAAEESDERAEAAGRTQWLSGNHANASVDQVEAGSGYTRGNVQLVHLRCNLAKRDVPEEEFIQMCRDVAARHGGGERVPS